MSEEEDWSKVRGSQRVDSHNKRLNRISAAKAQGLPATHLTRVPPPPHCTPTLCPEVEQVRKLIVRRQSKSSAAAGAPSPSAS